MTKEPTPPVAKQVPRTLETHGHARPDPYYWMRDDKRQNPEVLSYLQAENAYTKETLKPLAGFEEELFQEIKGRIKKDDATAPYQLDGYYYYTRFEEGGEYPIHCRKKGSLDAPEQIMLDANVEAQRHEYYHAAGLSVSADGKILAFSEDTLGRRIYRLRFRNLETGTDFDDSVPGTAGAVAWALDNQTMFYVRRDPETLRAYQVWRHRLGTKASSDVLVYEERDAEFYVSVHRTKSKRYIVIGSWQTISHEMRFVDAAAPEQPFQVFLPREAGHEYDIAHAGDRFYIRTNWNAPNFRLMSIDPKRTSDRTAWREEIAHRDRVFLRSFDVFQDHLVVAERRDGIARLRVIPWQGQATNEAAAHEIEFDEELFTADLDVNPEYESKSVRFEYTSLKTPPSIWDYQMDSRKRALRKQEEVLGGYEPNDYVSYRTMATARDGTSVPISIVHHRSLDRSKPHPLLQYGYGSYGISMDPTFRSSRLSLLERGVIYAIAHIRGGQEFGRAWYENGKLLKKKNTFTDFIDCSEHLIKEGFTTTNQLLAMGGSAGGLLMGAVVNMRPDLYHAAVANVPFVDVVTTMLDESIPLTTFEYDEWGNPNDETYYRYMLSYSPYDNVKAQRYPHLLVLAGLHDSQVQYWEPAKWVAKLRTHKTDQNPLLLWMNMDAGHGGASGRFRYHRETAMTFAFLLASVDRANVASTEADR